MLCKQVERRDGELILQVGGLLAAISCFIDHLSALRVQAAGTVVLISRRRQTAEPRTFVPQGTTR